MASAIEFARIVATFSDDNAEQFVSDPEFPVAARWLAKYADNEEVAIALITLLIADAVVQANGPPASYIKRRH